MNVIKVNPHFAQVHLVPLKTSGFLDNLGTTFSCIRLSGEPRKNRKIDGSILFEVSLSISTFVLHYTESSRLHNIAQKCPSFLLLTVQ